MDRRPMQRAAGWLRCWAASALLLAICALFALPAPAQPRRTTAEAVIERGILKVRRDGVETVHRELQVPIPLLETDSLQTGRRSRVTVTLLDSGETMKMYGSSHLSLAALRRDVTSIDLNVGKTLFAFFKDVLAKREIEINTETAVVGVKGTEFVVGTEEDESYVLTLKGEVSVVAKAAPDREVRVRPNELYFVTEEQVPEAPTRLKAAAREAILREEGLEKFRKEARAASLPPPEQREPVGLQLRVGPAIQRVVVPIAIPGGDAGERVVENSGAELVAAYRFWGPFSVLIGGFLGQHSSSRTASGDPAGDATGIDGRARQTMAMLGLGGELGGWFGWSVHGGAFESTSTLEAGGAAGGKSTLDLSGTLLRVELDILFGENGALGFDFNQGQGDAGGSEIDRLRALGYRPDSASYTLIGISAVGRF